MPLCLCEVETSQICYLCERPLCRECRVLFGGRIFCTSCREIVITCVSCSEYLDRDDAFYHDDREYCESCHNDRFSYCEDCREAFRRNGNRFCRYCEGAEEIQPTTFNIITSKRRAGMEIEFIPGDDSPNISGLGFLVGDGSVYSENRRGQEFVSAICSGDKILELIDKVSHEIRVTGGVVNKTCGLHIHLDMNGCTDYQGENIALWWQALEKIIHGMVAPSRRDNQYSCSCQGIDLRYWRGSRYYSLNISDSNGHGTFEVRVHNGTLDAKKIKGWVRFLLAFFDTFQHIDATAERIEKVKEMTHREKLIFIFQQLALPMSLKKYMVSRINKHGKDFLFLDKKNKGNPDLRMAA